MTSSSCVSDEAGELECYIAPALEQDAKRCSRLISITISICLSIECNRTHTRSMQRSSLDHDDAHLSPHTTLALKCRWSQVIPFNFNDNLLFQAGATTSSASNGKNNNNNNSGLGTQCDHAYRLSGRKSWPGRKLHRNRPGSTSESMNTNLLWLNFSHRISLSLCLDRLHAKC